MSLWDRFLRLPKIPVKQEDGSTRYAVYVGDLCGSPDSILAEAESRDLELVRLCVDSHHPIDPGNYEGPVHCTAHPDGHACVTALYARAAFTTVTDEERHREVRVTPSVPLGGSE